MANVLLRILGFKSDPTAKPRSIASGGDVTFESEIAPERVTFSKSIKWNDNNTANTSTGDIKQFQGYETEHLAVDLTIEKTGAMGTDVTEEVTAQVAKLHKAVYEYEGSIHKPRYVVVNINKELGFKGHLQDMDITYELFDSTGKPVIANVSLLFISHVDKETIDREAYNQSPDMSHIFTVREKDALPLMSLDVYNSSNYYLHVAELNELTNFRNLKIGNQLLFPPLINE